jgi:hypothetical protein
MVNDGGASVRVKLSGGGVGGRQPELWAEGTLDHYALGISLSVFFFLSEVLFTSSMKMKKKIHW